MTEDPNERVAELEIKLAFQDHKIAALEELIRGLAERLDESERKVAQLEESVRSPALPLGPPSELPPHY